MTDLRIGHGYDVHRLAEGRRLVLGGVEIPWEKGLLGHSDADVLVHAVMDALTGAARLGDIGRLFPDTDPAYAGISSLKLLRAVGELLEEKGFASRIDSVPFLKDIHVPTLVGVGALDKMTPPELAEEMAANIAAALGIDAEQVNVKATTEEGLGFTGDGSGMAAHAVVLLERQK